MVDISGVGKRRPERKRRKAREKGGDEPSEPHPNKMETEPTALAFTLSLPFPESQDTLSEVPVALQP